MSDLSEKNRALVERLYPGDHRPPSETDSCPIDGMIWMDEEVLDRLLDAAREEGRNEAAKIALDFLARHPDLAIGADLDILAAAAEIAPRRMIVDDGRPDDPMMGVPLETDAELRARLTGRR